MATTTAPIQKTAAYSMGSAAIAVPAPLAVVLISLIAAVVLGYHPYGDDAGIYLAGVKYLLHPANFPVDAIFITHHMQLSIFAYLMAALVRITHLSLETVAFFTHIILLATFLAGCLKLSRRLFPSPQMQWAAVATLALTLSTPVAGTALYLADPYLTGRSFIAPLAIFATCYVLERRWLLATLCVVLAALVHPLMAIYLAVMLVALAVANSPYTRWLIAMPFVAVATAAVISFSQRNVVESPAYVQAALTRTYFYLGQWQWYEDLGIFLPLVLLAALVYLMRSRWNSAARAIAFASIASGVSVTLVSLIFVHPHMHSHLLARMQVLREFQFIYGFMFLLVGAVVGHYLLRNSAWRWTAYLLLLSAGLYSTQRSLYPASQHLQLPWQSQAAQNENPWQQAFLWVRGNTPHDAVFAINPQYISIPGEDAIGFRVTAERSVLADYSKDGGAAAIFPSLADAWQQQVAAAAALDNISDDARRARLAPYGVTWIVLSRSAQTQLSCPFANSAVQVCKL